MPWWVRVLVYPESSVCGPRGVLWCLSTLVSICPHAEAAPFSLSSPSGYVSSLLHIEGEVLLGQIFVHHFIHLFFPLLRRLFLLGVKFQVDSYFLHRTEISLLLLSRLCPSSLTAFESLSGL